MNCTLHAEAVDVATIRLDEGSHGIRVDYFENTVRNMYAPSRNANC
jgi:hypothetical protein